MKQIVVFFSQYGLDVALCALLTTILTGLLKLPLKKIASKSNDYKRITKYITFLPIAIGFGFVTLYTYFENGVIHFEEIFFSRWLSSVSLSLAIYAFWEKFVPSRKKILNEAEISANRKAISEIENLIEAKRKNAIAAPKDDNVVKGNEERTIQAEHFGAIPKVADYENDEVVCARAIEDHTIGKIILKGGQNVKS